MSKSRFSIKMLMGSILAGLAYGLTGEWLYQHMERMVSHILLTFVYFTGMYLFVGCAVYTIGRYGHAHAHSPVNRRQWAAALALTMLLSALFAWIYGRMGNDSQTQASGYLFVIDHSDSMNRTDPDGMRYQAIETLLDDKDPAFAYGVYQFSDSAKLVRAMAPVREGGMGNEPVNAGGTAILHTLDTILQDLDNGRLQLEDNCRMILLSDGYATDMEKTSRYDCIRRLEQYADRGVSISTVSMTAGADSQLLTLIADKTGGIYVSVRDIQQLEQGMRQAAQTEEGSRNLLGYRSEKDTGILFPAARILFLICLGLLLAVEKTVVCERYLNTNSVLISSAAGSALAGICLEAGMNTLGMHPSAMRIALCILMAVTLLHEDTVSDTGMDRKQEICREEI